jgi:hypothetical protein
MELFNTIYNQFNRDAIVRELVSVLLVVIIIILKPEGAMMA